MALSSQGTLRILWCGTEVAWLSEQKDKLILVRNVWTVLIGIWYVEYGAAIRIWLRCVNFELLKIFALLERLLEWVRLFWHGDLIYDLKGLWTLRQLEFSLLIGSQLDLTFLPSLGLWEPSDGIGVTSWHSDMSDRSLYTCEMCPRCLESSVSTWF